MGFSLNMPLNFQHQVLGKITEVLETNMVSLPTRHILPLGQDHLALLFDAEGTPLASFFVSCLS